MIQFVSITSFRKRLAALLKVKRGVYAGVEAEICQAFKDATIEQIRQNRDMILMNNDQGRRLSFDLFGNEENTSCSSS